jgi:mono/diheme cytochrome c family protein
MGSARRHPLSCSARGLAPRRLAVRAGVAGLLGAIALGAGGCGVKGADNANLVAGKQAFVAKCGSCHALARANTRGVVGPDLDEVFRTSLAEGEQRNAVRTVVEGQVQNPNSAGVMPANLASGATLADIAAYVAQSVDRTGQDTGLLAQATQPKGPGVATTPQLAEGKAIFTGSGGCSSCHTLADAGSTGTIGPDLNKYLVGPKHLAKFIRESIVAPDAYVEKGFPANTMPQDFGTSLSAKQIDAIVAYLQKATEPAAGAKH